MPLSVGDKLGPYEILAPIGEGGMGEVWKARDTRLNRIVAIKRLNSQHAARFEKEARAVASLNHPNICLLYDIGPDYLVMEYIEGKPLSGRFPTEQAVRFAIQIASALEEAHGHGILHRDLKPGNILVTAKGSIKLLDFGLAKLVAEDDPDATRTTDGTVLGTAAYMSPEQAEGKPVDTRSDIFSFGAVLYEMLSGARAFGGGSLLETLNAVVREEPAPLQSPVADIVRRCLAKQPARRCQSMNEVRAALEQIGTKPAPEPQPSIAVLPFANMSGDKEQEYFSDGLAEEIINALTHIPGLKVTARTSAFSFKGKDVKVAQIAHELGVQHILEGSVRKSGNRIRITAQLISATDGFHLWSERYDRELTDIFAVQDEISSSIAAALKTKLAAGPEGWIRYAPNVAAYEAYLKAQHYWKQRTGESLGKALECFRQAICLDPMYAAAYAGLANCCLVLPFYHAGEPLPLLEQAKASAARAVELDPLSGSSLATMALLHAWADWDWVRANSEIEQALQRGPEDSQVHDWAAFVFASQGRMPEAVREINRALELDPLALQLQHHASWLFLLNRQFDHALEQTRKMIELDANFPLAYVWRGVALERLSRYGEAEAAFRTARRLFSGAVLRAGDSLLAHCLGVSGRERESKEILEKLEDLASREYVEPYVLALIHLGLGEPEKALSRIEQAVEVRSVWSTVYLKADSRLDPLRAHPRFQQLLVRMGLR